MARYPELPKFITSEGYHDTDFPQANTMAELVHPITREKLQPAPRNKLKLMEINNKNEYKELRFSDFWKKQDVIVDLSAVSLEEPRADISHLIYEVIRVNKTNGKVSTRPNIDLEPGETLLKNISTGEHTTRKRAYRADMFRRATREEGIKARQLNLANQEAAIKQAASDQTLIAADQVLGKD